MSIELEIRLARTEQKLDVGPGWDLESTVKDQPQSLFDAAARGLRGAFVLRGERSFVLLSLESKADLEIAGLFVDVDAGHRQRIGQHHRNINEWLRRK